MTPPNKDGKKTADRGPAGRFTKGNRASPGRPAGRGKVAELRDKLAQDLDQIITDGHVRPTSHGATHEGNQICCDGVGVGFGGVAACAGHVAYQAIEASGVRARGVAVVVQAIVIGRVGQDVEVAFHC